MTMVENANALASTSVGTASFQNANRRAFNLTGRSYISYSSISTYQRCPLRYKFIYIDGLTPAFKSSSLLFGGAIHSAIERHFVRMFEGTSAPKLDELMAVYDAAWRSDATTRIRFGKNESAESLRDLAARMLTAFQKSDAAYPDGELLVIEEEFRAPVIDGCPDLLGRIDLLVLTGDEVRIVDFKTSRSSWSESKVQDAAPQQLLYAELIKPITESFPDRQLRLEWVVLTKTKSPKIERHHIVPQRNQVKRTKVVVRRVWQAIEAGHFYPIPSAMNCSTCPYRTPCQKWEG